MPETDTDTDARPKTDPERRQEKMRMNEMSKKPSHKVLWCCQTVWLATWDANDDNGLQGDGLEGVLSAQWIY